MTTPFLSHTYAGPAYVVYWGGRHGPVERISGSFHVEDFQDGAGVLLTNGEQEPAPIPKRGERKIPQRRMGWMIPRTWLLVHRPRRAETP